MCISDTLFSTWVVGDVCQVYGIVFELEFLLCNSLKMVWLLMKRVFLEIEGDWILGMANIVPWFDW